MSAAAEVSRPSAPLSGGEVASLQGETERGLSGHTPVFTVLDEFGLWPLDFVPVAEGEDDELAPQGGTLVPTIVGVVLVSTILALALIVAWQWWQS